MLKHNPCQFCPLLLHGATIVQKLGFSPAKKVFAYGSWDRNIKAGSGKRTHFGSKNQPGDALSVHFDKAYQSLYMAEVAGIGRRPPRKKDPSGSSAWWHYRETVTTRPLAYSNTGQSTIDPFSPAVPIRPPLSTRM